MKIFALYFRTRIINKPEWLDGFLQKYYESSDLHITILQARYVDELKVDELKSKISQYFNQHKLTFSDKVINLEDPVFDQEQDGTYTIMLPITQNSLLYSFQKDMRELLREYENYVDLTTVQYEKDFKAHITIGVNIKANTLEEVKLFFSKGFLINIVVTDLVLPIVKNTSLEERYNPDNLTILKI